LIEAGKTKVPCSSHHINEIQEGLAIVSDLLLIFAGRGTRDVTGRRRGAHLAAAGEDGFGEEGANAGPPGACPPDGVPSRGAAVQILPPQHVWARQYVHIVRPVDM